MTGGLPTFESQIRADAFQVVRPSAASSEAESLFRMAATAQEASRQIMQGQLQTAVDAAGREGAATMIYEQQPDGTQRLRPLDEMLSPPLGLANRAYNDAVMRNYMGAVETDARQAFGSFQNEHRLDPQAFAAAAQGWIQRTVEAMPESARGTAHTQLSTLATAFAGQIAQQQNQAAQQQMFGTASQGARDAADDIDRLSAADPTDARIPQAMAALRQRLEDLRTQWPDRVTPQTVEQIVRETQRTVEANRLANETMGVVRRGGLQAAEQHLDAYARRGDIPYTTQERDQIVTRARAVARDLHNRQQTAAAAGRQAEADAERRALTAAGLALAPLPPADQAGRQAVIDQTISGLRGSPQLRDRVRLQLEAPEWARRHATAAQQQQQHQDALATIDLLTITRDNRRAVESGQPPPYPLSAIMEQLPPNRWGAALESLMQQQQRQEAQQRDFATLTGNVTLARQGSGIVTQGQLDEYVGGMFARGPETPLARRAPNLAEASEYSEVLQLARDLRMVPQVLRQQIEGGLSPAARYSDAQRAVQVYRNLTDQPGIRESIREVLGTTATRIDELAFDVARIEQDPNLIGADGRRDPNRVASAWLDIQRARQAAASVPDSQADAILRTIYGTDPQAGLVAAAQAGLAARDSGESVGTTLLIPGLLGLPTPMRITVPRPGDQQGAGVPDASPWLADIPGIGRIESPLFRFALWGERSVPVSSSADHLAAGPMQAFRRGVMAEVARGVRDPAALQAAGTQAMLERYQPSWLASDLADQALLVQNGPEAVGRVRYGLSPREVVGQAAEALANVAAAYERAGQRLPIPTYGDPLRAIASKDVIIRPLEGSDANPVFVLYVRPARGQPHRAILRLPGMAPPPAGIDARDAVVFQLRPNAEAVADRERDAAMRQEAQRTVNRVESLRSAPRAVHDAASWFAYQQLRLRNAAGLGGGQ